MVDEVIETEEEPEEDEALADEEFDAILDEIQKENLEEETKKDDKETESDEPSEEDEKAEIEILEEKDELDEDEQKRLDKLIEKYPKEDDDLTKRGKEIIDKEEQRRLDEEEAERQSEKDREEEDRKKSSSDIPVLSSEDADDFLKYIPPGRIPDTIKVGDVELDLKAYMEDNPESLIINTAQTQEYIIKLVKNGILMTNADFQAEVGKIQGEQDDRFFGLSVMVELQNLGHIGHDLDKLVASDEFDTWGKSQDDKVKALFRSDARDYAKGVRKYLSDAGLEKVKKTAKEHDEEALKKKKAHVAIHKNTMKSKPSHDSDATDEAFDAEVDRANRELEKQA